MMTFTDQLLGARPIEVKSEFYSKLYPSEFGFERPDVKVGTAPGESERKSQSNNVQVIYMKPTDNTSTMLMAGLLVAVLLLWIQVIGQE